MAAIKVSLPGRHVRLPGLRRRCSTRAAQIGRQAYTLTAGQSKTYKVKVSRKPASKRKPLTVKYRVSSRAAADKEGKLKLVL